MKSETIVQRVLLIPVAAAALIAAGCGGDDEDATTEWAGDVCSAFTDWTTEVRAAADSLSGGNLSRSGLEDAVGDVKDATDTLATDLGDLERPDTDAGQEAKDALDKLADGIATEVQTIQNAATGAETANELLSAVSVASSSLAKIGTQIRTTVQQLGQLDASGELRDAFEDADSCQELRSEES